MTRKIASTAIAAMFGFALTAAAQTPPSSPPSDPQTPPSATSPMPDRAQKADGKKLTGCIQAGTEAGSFELTNVKGKGDTGDKKTVKLAAAPGVDLATHVGHTVELSGSWEGGSASSSTSPSPSAPAASPSASGGDKTFSVSNVKMVSSTCSSGTN